MDMGSDGGRRSRDIEYWADVAFATLRGAKMIFHFLFLMGIKYDGGGLHLSATKEGGG